VDSYAERIGSLIFYLLISFTHKIDNLAHLRGSHV